MRRKKDLTIYKKNGVKQRSDVALTRNIANALVARLEQGLTLYPPDSKYIELETPEGLIKLNKITLNSWIFRGNAIVEDGKILRDVLDKAREMYRNKVAVQKDKSIVQDARRAIKRTLNLRTNLPVIGLTGILTDSKGNIIRKENSKLLGVKMDIAKFALSRLDPVYQDKQRVDNTHLVFSLADLRRARNSEEEVIHEDKQN